MTEVAIWQPRNDAVAIPDGALQLDSWIVVADQAVRLAREICNTPFVPDGLRGSAPAVAAAILAGRELGIGPMTALAHIHVIKGKPGLSAALQRALILSAGHEWRDVDVSDTRAVVEGRRRGETEWTRASFDAAQAAKARIDLGGYPQDKLYARATSRLARRKFADVIAGMPYSAEELEDGAEDEQHAVTVTPEPEAAIEPPKSRTAQRRTRTPAAVPTATGAETPAATAPEPAQPQELPPLPGEDEPEPEPEKRGNGKVGIVQAHFRRLQFTDDERDQRLAAAAAIAGLPEGTELATLNDLDDKQLSAVADTLSRCRDRSALVALLAAGDKADA